ncbi:MarR family transcriptional regulator [Arthrobacter jiangjiafuii]|uniref:MarR family transcriptional regulator n=1 Tax=Arthrobacter jiangjiafuii TaxID=2817475 RepID=A0A975M7N5_9MICC|nr:MarR family transcriptional regulator [Arthrobacter jiangjiafuii]MBP3042955.1 MarR family transcriptional regulator [Arthrobacter jiangjiafuii]QWC11483.1 MarR family transcriptional regulator [Arthrobacter jiangjiafuii]
MAVELPDLTPADRGPAEAEDGRAEAISEVEESLRLLTEAVRASMRDAAKGIDPALSLFGLKVLQLLKRVGPTQSGAVAELLMVDKSVVSRVSRQLEELGLIEVKPDPSDGRARVLALTPDAAERVRAVQTGIMLDHDVLHAWTARELRQFAGYLSRLGPRTGSRTGSRSGPPADKPE